jgi:hypothetical protein
MVTTICWVGREDNHTRQPSYRGRSSDIEGERMKAGIDEPVPVQ